MSIRKIMVVSAACCMALGLASSAHAATVLWFGKNCTDETGAPLREGALIQLVRSSDATIGPPDPSSGDPTGNDTVCATARYACDGSTCYFQGRNWSETENQYVCVRIWNAGDAASGTCYRDSAVYPASGMLPVNIDCQGAKTDKRK